MLTDQQINDLITRHEVHEYHPGAILEFSRALLALTPLDDYAVEINRLRNVIQAACTGGTDLMIERWKQLFPDAPVPTVKEPALSGCNVNAPAPSARPPVPPGPGMRRSAPPARAYDGIDD